MQKAKDSSAAEITVMMKKTRVNRNLRLAFFPLQQRAWGILSQDFFSF